MWVGPPPEDINRASCSWTRLRSCSYARLAAPLARGGRSQRRWPDCLTPRIEGPGLLLALPFAHPYSPKCVEGVSLLKNSLYARFGPRSGSKHTIFGAFWSFWSPIGSHFRLGADFFNRLGYSANFVLKLSEKSRRHPKRGPTKHPTRPVRPVLDPIEGPDTRPERHSHPFRTVSLRSSEKFACTHVDRKSACEALSAIQREARLHARSSARGRLDRTCAAQLG